MPFRIKVSLAIVFALLGLAVFGPLLIPARSLDGLVPPRDLADKDSRFLEVGGLDLHVKTAGEPGAEESNVVFLHGFGASVYTWHEVLPAFGEDGMAVAFDRPGFGLTERPEAGSWRRGENPYAADRHVDLTIALMDELGLDTAILVGNSTGGSIAAQVALEHPERVRALVLVGAAIYRAGGAPAWSRPLLHTPQLNRVGPLLMRTLAGEPGENLLRAAWADPERIEQETIDAYARYTRVEGWDRALWEVSKANRQPVAAGRLTEIDVPTLVITGAEDGVVPVADAERIAAELPAAELVVLESCGHTPQEECPAAFVRAVREWWIATRQTASR